MLLQTNELGELRTDVQKDRGHFDMLCQQLEGRLAQESTEKGAAIERQSQHFTGVCATLSQTVVEKHRSLEETSQQMRRELAANYEEATKRGAELEAAVTAEKRRGDERAEKQDVAVAASVLELRQALDSATTAQVERLEALESGAELEAKTARKAEARLEDMQCNATAVAKETCDTDRARFEREVSRVERELKCAGTLLTVAG